jgi:hypothetical protein
LFVINFLFFSLNCILLEFFSINFYSNSFFFCFCRFFINIFLPISSFKIKLVENYASWLNLGQTFHGIRLFEIRPDLRGLPSLPCFFPFYKLMFSYFLILFFLLLFCFFSSIFFSYFILFVLFGFIGLASNNVFLFHPLSIFNL